MRPTPLQSVQEANRILGGIVANPDDEVVATSVAALIRDEHVGLGDALTCLSRATGTRLQLACLAFVAGVLYERDGA